MAMVAAAGLAAPAHAIETAEFGVAPTDGRQHLKEEVRPGRTTTDSVRVWNKTDHPVSVRLSVVGASLDGTGAGSVRLGGTGGAMSWVRISQPAIDLAPHAGQIVSFSVHAPRELPPGTSTAALVAEPILPIGQQPAAVVQRVAVMAYFAAPAGSSLTAALGWLAWVAAAALALVLVYALAPVRRGAGPRRRVSRLATLRFRVQ
ncbi:MAG TPA: hypothetical protein VFA94_15620 [Acidimicrobiales bacterium]|nr:hypothetical protein [Acidimicrobiales bacterium]